MFPDKVWGALAWVCRWPVEPHFPLESLKMPVKQVCKRDNGARTCMENVSEKWGAGRCLCSAMPDCAHAGRAGHHPTGSFPVCVASCPTHPCSQQGAEGGMRQCLTSLSPFHSLSSLLLPATILASCRRHHSSIQREEDCPSLCSPDDECGLTPLSSTERCGGSDHGKEEKHSGLSAPFSPH